MIDPSLLILVCNSTLLLYLLMRHAEMYGELLSLRREVEECLRILYAAVEEDPEGGDQDA